MGKRSRKKYNGASKNQLFRCCECKEQLPQGKFDKQQLKLTEARCKSCIHTIEKEVNAKLADLFAEDKAISDEDLFKMPSPKDDCAICSLRLPLEEELCSYQPCCGQMLCGACLSDMIANTPGVSQQLCPFCREPEDRLLREVVERFKRRADLNDPWACFNLGCKYNRGTMGLPENHAKALLCWLKAGEMGISEAFSLVSQAFRCGTGVERDKEKEIHFDKRAAMLGHHISRHNLGARELTAGDHSLAMKHFKIAAIAGHKDSLDTVQLGFKGGLVTKDEFEETLRAYQESISEMKSISRVKSAPLIHNNMRHVNDPTRAVSDIDRSLNRTLNEMKMNSTERGTTAPKTAQGGSNKLP